MSQQRKKIQYVYLAEIQILVKSLFKEGINSPIVLSIHNQRFNDPSIGHLGTKKEIYVTLNCYSHVTLDIVYTSKIKISMKH